MLVQPAGVLRELEAYGGTRMATERSTAESARVDWTQLEDHDHFVQFYESDAALTESLRGYIATGLRRGEVGVVIATDEHRRDLERRLAADGDVEEAKRLRRYVALDADQTLSEFMVRGMPDPAKFTRTMDAVFAEVGGDGRRVRAFGEMVALLWASGNREAALRLEELWNDLARSYLFTLYCAYPAAGFGGVGLEDWRQEICGRHTRTMPALGAA